MAPAFRSKANKAIDDILESTLQRPRSAQPPTKARSKPFALVFKEWASSQVAAYRVGLVIGYLAMMYFGASALIAGVPTFTFTTPEGWTPVWAVIVIIGGLIGGVGSLRAGTEPVTKEIRVFNRIELTGSVMLFLTLGTYAAILLILAYGYGDVTRASIGAGFVALGVHPAVRMIWLIFRPRFVGISEHIDHMNSGPLVHIPPGYILAKLDENGVPLPTDYTMHKSHPETDSTNPGTQGA